MARRTYVRKGIALACSLMLALQCAACGAKEAPVTKAMWTGDEDVKPPALQNQEPAQDVGGGQGENVVVDSLDGSLAYFENLEETGQVYTQTIMIYVVGSDLESGYGSASRDLKEMEQAGADTVNNNIVVYLGGAKDWEYRFPQKHGKGLYFKQFCQLLSGELRHGQIRADPLGPRFGPCVRVRRG